MSRSLLVVAALSLFAVACSGDDDTAEGRVDPAAAAAAELDRLESEPVEITGDGTTNSSSTSTTSTSTTTTTTVPGIVVNKYSLTIDDCFDQLEDLAAGRAREITTKVACTEPHDAQIFSRVTYPAEVGELYPGDDIVEDYALAACYQRFADWADSVYETSALDIQAIVPTRDDFEELDYRGIQCYVDRADGDKLVGTARSSGL